MLISYLTTRAEKKLQSSDNLVLHEHVIMPMLHELPDFSEEEKMYLLLLPLNGGVNPYDTKNLTITIFAHKCADHLSVVNKVLAYGAPLTQAVRTHDQIGLLRDIDCSNKYENFSKFLPTIIPAYKGSDLKYSLSGFLEAANSDQPRLAIT